MAAHSVTHRLISVLSIAAPHCNGFLTFLASCCAHEPPWTVIGSVQCCEQHGFPSTLADVVQAVYLKPVNAHIHNHVAGKSCSTQNAA